jgi:hypothetical protein
LVGYYEIQYHHLNISHTSNLTSLLITIDNQNTTAMPNISLTTFVKTHMKNPN